MIDKEKGSHRIPAEWEEHEATWIGWPHNREDWPGKFAPVPWVYAEIVKKISLGEKVRIIVEDKVHEKKALDVLKSADTNLAGVEFFSLKTDRGWLRDSFPVFVKNKKEIAAVDFHFNGWAKYPDHKKDRKVPAFVSKIFNLQRKDAVHSNRNVVLEGGAIDANGSGTLMTTEECLTDDRTQARNPGFTRRDYEEVFENYLGISKVLWLGKGIAGDDTHGHVDDLCRFVGNDKIILVSEKNPRDENYKNLNENRERAQDFRLKDGTKVETVLLPMPSPVIFKNQRLPASYANFYISNFAVLVPTFNDPNDATAVGIIGELIGDRPAIGIHAVDLVWGLGTLHCLTHEQPVWGHEETLRP